MISATRVRATLTACAVALAAGLAGCAEPPPAKPLPVPPTASLSPKLLEQASAYSYYVNRATQISPGFTSGDEIATALKTGVAYEPKQLLQGAIAYGAVVALQDPAFVAGVRTYAGDPEQRRTIAYEIMKDPAYVVGINGSASAAGLVTAALGDQGNKLYAAGKAVKQAAYDVQKQKWSKADVANRDARLIQAKTLSATPLAGDVAETARLQQASTGAVPLGLTAQPASPPYTRVVIRSMAVAALALLGQATEANATTLDAVMAEPTIGSCINMSKLNLYQCLAVSKPHYEDIFCLGQHAMMDTGRCVIKMSGQTEPYEPRFVPTVRVADQDKPAKSTGKPAAKGPTKKR